MSFSRGCGVWGVDAPMGLSIINPFFESLWPFLLCLFHLPTILAIQSWRERLVYHVTRPCDTCSAWWSAPCSGFREADKVHSVEINDMRLVVSLWNIQELCPGLSPTHCLLQTQTSSKISSWENAGSNLPCYIRVFFQKVFREHISSKGTEVNRVDALLCLCHHLEGSLQTPTPYNWSQRETSREKDVETIIPPSPTLHPSLLILSLILSHGQLGIARLYHLQVLKTKFPW